MVDFSPESLTFIATNDDGCSNRRDHGVCNWANSSDSNLCLACQTNQVIPDLNVDGNLHKWTKVEEAKRRLFYTCYRLGLPTEGLSFRFMVNTAHETATTGHCQGVITLNIWEADPVAREQMRASLDEKLRTLVGHFRHEYGHYYWEQTISPDPQALQLFRELFGDERQDYQQSLNTHYSQGSDKGHEHITVYASSHPWEDWAESVAHYLHLRDALETAQEFGFSPTRDFNFEDAISEWVRLSVAFNEMNRSLGLPDLYPFALTPAVIEKLGFVHRTVIGGLI